MTISKETMNSLVEQIAECVTDRIEEDRTDATGAVEPAPAGFPSYVKRGKRLFIRTVTFHIIGTVKRREGNWVELKDARHVRSSGEDFGKFLKSGPMNDSRLYPFPGTVTIHAAAVTDFCEWTAD